MGRKLIWTKKYTLSELQAIKDAAIEAVEKGEHFTIDKFCPLHRGYSDVILAHALTRHKGSKEVRELHQQIKGILKGAIIEDGLSASQCRMHMFILRTNYGMIEPEPERKISMDQGLQAMKELYNAIDGNTAGIRQDQDDSE